MTDEHGNRITLPTMIFDGRKGQHFSSPCNHLLVIELKVANALVWILIDTGSSTNIIP